MANAPQSKLDVETQFLDMLYRVSKSPAGFYALYFKISEIKPMNRAPAQMRQVRQLISLLKVQQRAFFLFDGDVCVISQGLPADQAEKLISEVRHLFRHDQLFLKNEDGFATVYDLSAQYDDVLKLAQQKEESLRDVRRKKAQNTATVPIEPSHLNAILKNIERLNVLKVIRRQEAVEVTPNGRFASLFYEYINSIADLKQEIAPTVDMLSNRWLFQHLSETLDRRMLSVSAGLTAHTPKGISLNLNISTVFTREFEDFLNLLPEGLSVYVEVQLMDIIQNTPNYFKALERLHEAGCRLCIDGVYPISLEFLDFNLFGADFVKLIWSKNLPAYKGRKTIQNLIGEAGADKIILSRVEDEEALKWALPLNVRRFQGYFIDSLSGAAARRKCPYRNLCTLSQCVSRKACIAGPVWAQCQAKEVLDASFEKNLSR